jgi:hypothetical protein
MSAIHDQFTHQMRRRLKTTGMGLGLVQLLQDAGLIEEARRTLFLLEKGFKGASQKSAPPIHKPCKANRLKVSSRTFSFKSPNAKHEFV